MAVKTVTKDLSGLGSIIKNYSTGSDGGFLSRIKTVVFYDVLDASLNEMYDKLLNSIGKIEINTVINGPDGETMNLDDVLTQVELLKRRVDKLYTFHYDFSMGATGAVDLQIGQKFSGTFSYKWGDFMLTQSSYIQGVSNWSVTGGSSQTLLAGLAACESAGLKGGDSKISDIRSMEDLTATLPNPSGLGLNALTSDTKASVTFTSQLWTDPESSDLTPITSSVRLTWCVPKLFGTVAGTAGEEPAVNAGILSQWVRGEGSGTFRNYMTYKGSYSFNCSPGPVYPVFALPAAEVPENSLRDIFNHITVEGFSNTRWKKGDGEITVSVNGIDTRYIWFYNQDLQTDPNLEVVLR